LRSEKPRQRREGFLSQGAWQETSAGFMGGGRSTERCAEVTATERHHERQQASEISS